MKQLAFWELDNIQPKKSRRNFLHREELSWDYDLYQDIEDFEFTSNALDLCF